MTRHVICRRQLHAHQQQPTLSLADLCASLPASQCVARVESARGKNMFECRLMGRSGSVAKGQEGTGDTTCRSNGNDVDSGSSGSMGDMRLYELAARFRSTVWVKRGMPSASVRDPCASACDPCA